MSSSLILSEVQKLRNSLQHRHSYKSEEEDLLFLSISIKETQELSSNSCLLFPNSSLEGGICIIFSSKFYLVTDVNEPHSFFH